MKKNSNHAKVIFLPVNGKAVTTGKLCKEAWKVLGISQQVLLRLIKHGTFSLQHSGYFDYEIKGVEYDKMEL